VTTLALPFPPSVNTYWRHDRGRTHISHDGLRFRHTVAALWLEHGGPGFKATDRLALTVEVRPPDKRRRDLDNVLKAIQDSLEHAGVFPDDSQIDSLLVHRVAPQVGLGGVLVTVEAITGTA